MNWRERIDIALNTRRVAGTIRTRIVVENSTGRFLYSKGRQYYNFSTNDYLGLSRHPAVIRAWKQGAEYYGAGSGGSSHISGYTSAHQKLEEVLADWLGYPRALLFISGFTANQALITALTTGKDLIIADRFSHASLLEAASLSAARLRRFSHNNVNHMQVLLEKPCNGQRVVITEGIFSMDGDAAPLDNILNIAKTNRAWTLVDDAHGIGILGKEGQGSTSVYNVQPELLVVTFGKGIGISGAAVLCNEVIAEYLLQFSRHLIYSTSMPPAQAVALLAALKIVRGNEGKELRERLTEYIKRFRIASKGINFRFTDSHSPIQPLVIGDNSCALHLANILRSYGIWATAIRPPAVPKGTARLRLTFTAAHKIQDINLLLEVLYAISQ